MKYYTRIFLIIFIKLILFNCYSVDIPKNLIVKVLEKGNQKSKKTKDLDLISVNYTGWILNDNAQTENFCEAKGVMFDSNEIDKFNHKVPFKFILGKGIVIKGWDIGLKDMNIDEKRCLVIPSQFAYGNRKIGNIIKPNSTLIFEVKLLNIVKTQ